MNGIKGRGSDKPSSMKWRKPNPSTSDSKANDIQGFFRIGG